MKEQKPQQSQPNWMADLVMRRTDCRVNDQDKKRIAAMQEKERQRKALEQGG